jgi:ERI1 exoribonuclease 3
MSETEGVIFTPDNFIFVTAGDWDLKTMLPKDLNRWDINKIKPIWKRWFNIKNGFKELYQVKCGSMTNVMNYLNIELEGTLHRGIDDCHNIGKILRKFFNDGFKLKSKHISKIKN